MRRTYHGRPYEDARISEELLARVTRMIGRGESLIVFGPRHVGKRYILERIANGCHGSVTALGVALFPLVSSDDPVLCDGCEGSYPTGTVLRGYGPAEVLAWVDEKLPRAEPGRPVVLLVANPDSLAYEAVRALLAELAVRLRGPGRDGRLAVAITGEVVLPRRLAEDAPWWHAAFALQGFARAEFEADGRKYTTGFGLRVEDSWDDLYERTGGSLYVLRLLLWAAFDRWSRETRPERSVRLGDLPAAVVAHQMPWNYYLRYVTRIITLERARWQRLEELVDGRTVEAPADGPDELELAGLAVLTEDGAHLRLGRTIVHDCLRNYFTPRRFADLHVGAGDWDGARNRYHTVPEPDRIRPTSTEDYADASNTVNDLCLSLYKEATTEGRGRAACQRFEEGGVYVLGFPGVTWWVWRDKTWQLARGYYAPGHGPGPDEWYHAVLPPPPEGEYAPKPVGVSADRELDTLVALIFPQRTDEPEAVVLGGPGPHVYLSRARRRLAASLLDHFLTAHGHALALERDRVRLMRRQQYGTIIHEIMTGLGVETVSIEDALRIACQGLWQAGYRRVLVCLIDPTGQRLEAVYAEPPTTTQLLLKLTQYELTRQPEKSVQVKVTKSGRSHATSDFRRDPDADRSVADKTDLRGGVIVPLLARELVIGTLLVETQDHENRTPASAGVKPTPEEVLDLEMFARKLAAAIEQAERVNLLQDALERQREPVLLVDGRLRIRYANGQTAKYLGVPRGWRRREAADLLPDTPPTADSDVPARAKEMVEEAWRNGRLVRHLALRHDGRTLHVAFLADRLLNGCGRSAGVFANGQDVTCVYGIFDVLRRLNAANRYRPTTGGLRSDTSHTQNLIDATVRIVRDVLNHSWALLYQTDERAPDLLSLRTVSGWSGEEAEDPGPLVTGPGAHWASELCLKTRAPVMFLHDPNGPDQKRQTSSRGLEALNVRTPPPGPVEWCAGEYRLDFPLLAGTEVLGKLILACRSEYDPEEFAFMTVLADLLGGLLESSRWFEQKWRGRLEQLEEDAGLFQREFYHYLGNRTANLSTHLTELQQVAATPTLSEPLRSRCRQMVEGFAQTLQRLENGRRTLGKWTVSQFLVLQRADLCEVVRAATADEFPSGGTVRFEGPATLYLDIDPDRLKTVLAELMENSRQWFPADRGDHLRVRVTVDKVREAGRPLARLVYEDNGVGIAAEDLNKVFRLDFTRREEGTGFGLYYASTVVRRHGGTIEVESPATGGARFVIKLPRPATTPAAAAAHRTEGDSVLLDR